MFAGCHPTVSESRVRMHDKVGSWMKSNRCTPHHQDGSLVLFIIALPTSAIQLPDEPLMVGLDAVLPERSVRDLGIRVRIPESHIQVYHIGHFSITEIPV